MSGTTTTTTVTPTISEGWGDGYFIYVALSDGTLWYRQRPGFTETTTTWTQIAGPTETTT